jgi:hypothetical protein
MGSLSARGEGFLTFLLVYLLVHPRARPGIVQPAHSAGSRYREGAKLLHDLERQGRALGGVEAKHTVDQGVQLRRRPRPQAP